jgi:hypothetical protein
MGVKRLYIPRSIPMTWPFTFSSPSVEFHRRKDAPGTLKAGARAREAVRGICALETSRLLVLLSLERKGKKGFPVRGQLTARERREDSIVVVLQGARNQKRKE